jgi:hypothetical protein
MFQMYGEFAEVLAKIFIFSFVGQVSPPPEKVLRFVEHPAAHDFIAAKSAPDSVDSPVEPLLPAGFIPVGANSHLTRTGRKVRYAYSNEPYLATQFEVL